MMEDVLVLLRKARPLLIVVVVLELSLGLLLVSDVAYVLLLIPVFLPDRPQFVSFIGTWKNVGVQDFTFWHPKFGSITINSDDNDVKCHMYSSFRPEDSFQTVHTTKPYSGRFYEKIYLENSGRYVYRVQVAGAEYVETRDDGCYIGDADNNPYKFFQNLFRRWQEDGKWTHIKGYYVPLWKLYWTQDLVISALKNNETVNAQMLYARSFNLTETEYPYTAVNGTVWLQGYQQCYGQVVSFLVGGTNSTAQHELNNWWFVQQILALFEHADSLSVDLARGFINKRTLYAAFPYVNQNGLIRAARYTNDFNDHYDNGSLIADTSKTTYVI